MNFDDLVDNIAPRLGDHMEAVTKIMDLLDAFHRAKEEQYQLSFAKRGEMGVWYNLARQADRMDGVAKLALQGEHTAALVDTLVDMAIYSIKWLAVIQAIRPEDFQKWLKEIYCPYMGLEYEAVLVYLTGVDNHNYDATDAFAFISGIDWAIKPSESAMGVRVRRTAHIYNDDGDIVGTVESDDDSAIGG